MAGKFIHNLQTSQFHFVPLDNSRNVSKLVGAMKHKHLRTTAQVIAALGGKRAVADLTGRSWSAVWNWEDRKAFPPNTYAIIKGALQANGMAAPDSLWGMFTASEFAS
jgi:hypothetical protein